MTIRFAAARRTECGPVSRVLNAAVLLEAANDHGWKLAEDAVMKEALRHFARHGLGAARAADEEAAVALSNGDVQAHDRWLAICRTLDPHLRRAR